MQVLLVSCVGAWLPRLARGLHKRKALAGLWMSDKNRDHIPEDKFKRAWPFHVTMKPFYHLAGIGARERIYQGLFPIWRWWLRSQKPPPFDVVHAIMGYGTEAFDLAERTGALKVIEASSSHPTSFYGFWQREIDIWCPGTKPSIPRWMFARCNRELERADVIACVSDFVKDSMIYNGIPASKCKVNPFGVDTSVFIPRKSLPQKPRFVCVGAICLRKGHQYLFRAFEKARVALGDAELICVGSYYPDFKRERKRWEGTFIHYENLPHDELSKILNDSTAFVFPSNEEGFARAILEAMSVGLPIVATHESGATTLVRDGVEGLIVRSRNIDQLAEAMIKMATDRSLNEKMGLAAYERGAKNNTWDDYADRAMIIYSEALKWKPLVGPKR